MKKKILKYISFALTCVVIAGSSVTSPLTVYAEDYVTRYDYVTGLFSYDVCNSTFRWDRNFTLPMYKYPIYTLYIKKGLGETKMVEIDRFTAELYINPDNPDVLEIVRNFNPHKVTVDYDVLTVELVEQLEINIPEQEKAIIEKVKDGDFSDFLERTETSLPLDRMINCPRSSFNDIKLGNRKYAFEYAISNDNLKNNATRFLFADYTGVASGYSDGSFRPNAYITNEDAAVLVYRMLQNPYFMKDGNNNVAGFELPKPNRELLKAYTDGDSVSEYARDAVSVLVQLNFITPENNRLNPKAFATTPYVNQIYKEVNDFFNKHDIDNWYDLDSDPEYTKFINWDRRAKIYSEADVEKLKRNSN